MAFNPFDVFRRNQKILFAGLTVVVMFMFVLSFGQGDFFQRIPQWLGSRQRTGDVLAVVDGSKVYGSELGRLETNRQLANQYMAVAATRAAANLSKSIADSTARVTPENRQVFQLLLAARPLYISPQMQQFAGQLPPQFLLQNRQQTIDGLRGALREILTAKAPKENDLEVAQAAQTLMTLDETTAGGRGFYFFNQPNQNTRDVLEFYLWLKKADALGIKLTDGDVGTLVNDEFLRKLTNDDLRAAEAGLTGKRGFTPDQLRSALADEFRVRAAQAAVLGPDYVKPTGRWYDAPYDYFAYYREQCSPGRFGIISLPAANFTDQVKGEPTETELRDLFQKAKGLEPNPASPQVGLREPRKLKLEWVEVTGTEPYYQAAAAEGVRKADALAKVGLFIAPTWGESLAGLIVAAGTAYTIPDAVLEAKYKEYKADQQTVARDNWYSQPFAFMAPQLLDAFAVRPENVAAVAGPALPTAVGFEADRKARLRSLAAAFVAPVAAVGVPDALLTTVAAEAAATRPLPLAAVRAQLVEKAKADFARTIANGDLRAFEAEEAKLAGKDAEAKAYAEKFAKDRGLKTGRSAEFRDQYAIADDPGLAPLKDRLTGTHSPFQAPVYVNPASFGRRFFFEQDFSPFGGGREVPATGFYKPQTYPQPRAELTPPPPASPFAPAPTPESVFLVWRTAEEDSVSPRDFNSPGAREKALAAWRALKARGLAREAAEKLAKECDHLGTGVADIEPKLTDKQRELAARFKTPAEKAGVKFFREDNVAPIVTSRQAGMGQEQVRPFQLEPSANVPYPTQKMDDELLAAKEKPLSTAVVLVDQPETTYYVAVLMGRQEQMVYEFTQNVYNPLTGPLGRPQLEAAVSQRHQYELRKDARDTAVALLKAEFRYDKENESALKQKADTAGE